MNNILIALIGFLSLQNQPMYVTTEEENVYLNQEKTLKITTIDCKEKVYLDLSYVTYSDEWNSVKQITFSNGVTCEISKIEENTLFKS